MKMFAIYDSKVDAFLPPFLAENDQVAARMVLAACQQPGSNFFRFAADYTLFQIADWIENEGAVVMHAAKLNFGTIMQLLSAEQANGTSVLEAVEEVVNR